MIDPKWHPDWPEWERKLIWEFRNPPTVGPAADAEREIPTWNPKGGWWFFLHKDELPFISYRGKWVEGYVGWRPSGAFGIAIRHSGAKGSEQLHK